MANLTRISALGNVSPINIGNARSIIDLEGDTRTLAVQIRLSASVAIAVANGTRVLNGGSIFAAVQEIGIAEGGDDTFIMDGRSALALSIATNETDAHVGAQRLTSPNIGTTTLRDTIWLPITLTRSLSPIETVYNQLSRGSGVQFEVFFRIQTTDANGVLVTPGAGGTAVLSNIAAEVVQVVDLQAGTPGLFIPRVRQVTHNITGANARERMKLSSSNVLRGILIQQDAVGVGDVNDIINRAIVRNDQRAFIGPQSMAFQDMQTLMDRANLGALRNHGGVSTSPGGVYAFLDFAENGRLSNVLNPLAGANFRLELDVQPSVTSGATASRVVVTLLELIQAGDRTATPPFAV